jgi:acetyltransferase
MAATGQSHAIAAGGSDGWIARLKDGRMARLRAVRCDDVEGVQEFVRGLSARSRSNRFFTPVRELSPDQLDHVMRSRFPGELALVAESESGAGSRIIAMAQCAASEPLDAEFAVVVDDAWQRLGLGTRLIGVLAEHAARTGFSTFTGLVLADNAPMLSLLSRLDCELVTDHDPYVVRAVKRFDRHERTPDRRRRSGHAVTMPA